MRLLLVMNACMSLPDKEGCTPLHWGAIRGNGEACTLLLQVGLCTWHTPGTLELVLGEPSRAVIACSRGSASEQTEPHMRLGGLVCQWCAASCI